MRKNSMKKEWVDYSTYGCYFISYNNGIGKDFNLSEITFNEGNYFSFKYSKIKNKDIEDIRVLSDGFIEEFKIVELNRENSYKDPNYFFGNPSHSFVCYDTKYLSTCTIFNDMLMSGKKTVFNKNNFDEKLNIIKPKKVKEKQKQKLSIHNSKYYNNDNSQTVDVMKNFEYFKNSQKMLFNLLSKKENIKYKSNLEIRKKDTQSLENFLEKMMQNCKKSTLKNVN